MTKEETRRQLLERLEELRKELNAWSDELLKNIDDAIAYPEELLDYAQHIAALNEQIKNGESILQAISGRYYEL